MKLVCFRTKRPEAESLEDYVMAAAVTPQSRKRRRPAASRPGKVDPMKAVKSEDGDLMIDETFDGSMDEPDAEWDADSIPRVKLENDDDEADADVDENFGEIKTKVGKSRLRSRKLKGQLAGKES